MFMKQLSKPGLMMVAMFGLMTAAAQVPDHKTIATGLNEETCHIISGDYGDPEATMHVISHCEGVGGWTLVQHEYAKSEDAVFKHGDKPETAKLPFESIGPISGLIENVDWVTIDGTVIGAVVGKMDYNWNGPPPNEFLNYYAIALTEGDTPQACIIARIEGITKRGAQSASELALLLFHDHWTCGTSKSLTFTADSTGSTSYTNAVFEKARELGAIPPD